MILFLRRKLIDTLIWLLERDLYNTPVKRVLDEEQKMVFFDFLWDHPGFREFCIERETRFVHALAKTDDPTARAQIKGQRMESMLWFTRARVASEKRKKRLEEQARASSSKRSA